MAIAIVKKLSAKVLLGNVKSHIKDLQDGQSIDVMRVVGLARGTKSGTSTYGDWTALMGDFVAEALVGAKKDVRFRTGQLFLPDVALNLIAPTVENLGRGDSVEMAFTIGVVADASAGPGYTYNCSFLVEPKENDPMELLLAKALPAPKSEEPAKEPAKTK